MIRRGSTANGTAYVAMFRDRLPGPRSWTCRPRDETGPTDLRNSSPAGFGADRFRGVVVSVGCAALPRPRTVARPARVWGDPSHWGAIRCRFSGCGGDGRFGQPPRCLTSGKAATTGQAPPRSSGCVLRRHTDGEAFATFLAPPAEHGTAPARLHPRAKAVLVAPPPVTRSICRFHVGSLFRAWKPSRASRGGSRLTFPHRRDNIGRPLYYLPV
jgi:hypothetical protein